MPFLFRAITSPVWLLGSSAALTIVAVSVLAVTLSLQDLVTRKRAAKLRTTEQAHTAAEVVGANITAAEGTLHATASFFGKHRGEPLRQLLAKFVAASDLVVQLSVVQLDGRFVASNVTASIDNIDLSDRDHIAIHKSAGAPPLFVSRPVLGRVSNRVTIQVSKRLLHDDAEAPHIFVASLDVDRMLHRLQSYVDPETSTLKISRSNRDEVVFSDGNEAVASDCNVAKNIFPGVVQSLGLQNLQRDCLVIRKRIDSRDLDIILTNNLSDVYSEWRDSSLYILTASLLSIFFVGLAFAFVAKSIQWRKRQALLITEKEEERRRTWLLAEILAQKDSYVIVFNEHDGQLLYANDKVKSDLGNYIEGKKIDSEALFGSTAQALKFSVAQTSVGKYRRIAWSISSWVSTESAYQVAYGIDRSDLDELSTELLHRFQLSELGMLTAFIVHEMKQPLNAISLALPVAALNLQNNVKCLAPIQIIENCIARLKFLFSQATILSRRDPGIRGSICLEKITRDVVALMIGETAQKGVDIEFRFGESIQAFASEAYVSHIILILVRNALDAVAGHRGDRRIVISGRATDTEAILLVEDTGPGVPPEIRHEIFDPFFTTKMKSGGAGLGLSIARAIAAELDCSISLIEAENGAAFELRLPRTATREARVVLGLRSLERG